jgi:crotonobetainyl-CoA:carnitine CoA-transferase CaiB-like acyl-CoA transferase
MGNLPLEGYRVIDFGWAAAAPRATCLLADMGAEVIKVETRLALITWQEIQRWIRFFTVSIVTSWVFF